MSSGRAVILLSARRTSRRSVASHANRASSILFRDASKVRTPAGKRGSWRASFPEMSRTRRRTHARRSGKGDASAFRDATSVSSAAHRANQLGRRSRRHAASDTRRKSTHEEQSGTSVNAFPSTRSVWSDAQLGSAAGSASSRAPRRSNVATAEKRTKKAGRNGARRSSASPGFPAAEPDASFPRRVNARTSSGSHPRVARAARRYSLT